MFWIQENGLNKNNTGYKLFYAEFENDIILLPTNVKDGSQEGHDSTANHKCALGSECYCIENNILYVLTTSGWTKGRTLSAVPSLDENGTLYF